MSEFDLHPDRLGTTDEFGRRVFPQPADVRGRFRRRRTGMQIVLLAIFLFLPWLRIGGHQALLLDLSQRHFEIFGLSLRAHNAPLLFFVFAAFCFGLFFVTAVWGRLWCGWACPQTVFIDLVYRRIERLIEGPALERRKLDRSPLSAHKIFLRLAKWMAFLLVSSIVAHSFMAYFLGTEPLRAMMTHSPSDNAGSFLFMSAVSLFLTFNFGWFREQFCVIACPYGRFQSVLMDSNSMIVAYDTERAEPRATPQAKALAKNHGSRLGDCVNCYRCVQVCPVGIDIRRGVQMECIACTGCMDACDDVMTKIKKPKGLIRYDSLNGLKGRPVRRLNARSVGYGVVSLLSLAALFVFVSLIRPVEIHFFRAKESPYQALEGGQIINHFKLEISNESNAQHALEFSSPTSEVALITAVTPLPVAAEDVARSSLFIEFPKTLLRSGQAKIQVRIKDRDLLSGVTSESSQEVELVGPFS